MNPPVIAARLKDTHRLIPSRYPPTGILDLIASPGDFEAVAELEGWTNDRISAELGVLSILPAGEWVLGRANATAIMAAYCHPNETGGRFTGSDRGAWYAALSIETAIKETVFHRTREIGFDSIDIFADPYDTDEMEPCFERPLPDGSGSMSGGGGGMGNIGYLARLDADSSLRWVAVMFHSNPFVGVRYEGTRAVFTNDWGNLLTLDLTTPALG